jgi:flagellar biosynthetic protein FliP
VTGARAGSRRRVNPVSALRWAIALALLVFGLLVVTASVSDAAPKAPPAATVIDRTSFDTTTPAANTPVSEPIVAPTAGSNPINLNTKSTNSLLSNPIGLVLALGLVSFVPAILIMMTAFTRIVIVLGFTRSALSTNSIPPNQVIIGLALFLTLFVMGPTFTKINNDAVQPYMHGKITQTVAYDRGMEPIRGFMLKQVRTKDLVLFEKMSGKATPTSPDKVPTTTLIPAYVLSELRTAFLIGFIVFIPFLVIDMVVSAALSSLGMVMLPPALISLPFKLLLFVAADGWYLVVDSLVRSFHT